MIAVNKKNFSDSVTQTVSVLNNGNVIAYPTESVFGIGCDPDSKAAVFRLLTLKRRSVEKGLILIAARYEQLKPYVDDSMLTQIQREKIFSTWPGPVTFVFPALPTTPPWLMGRFNSIAVRVTNHPLVIEICESFGKPLVSTSANLTGLLPSRTTDEVHKQFGDSCLIIIGETGGYRNPSEIRNALTGKCLRQG